jgi:O-antigen ligase
MNPAYAKIKPATAALFALVGLLFFIWPMPHTISLRQSLIGLVLALSAYLAFKERPRIRECKGLALPLAILVILITWMHAVAVFISTETASSLHDIRGQWLTSALIMFMGSAAAFASSGEGRASKGVLISIFAALMAHVIYHDLDAIFRLFSEGALPRNEGALAGGRDKMSYISILAITFCIAEGYLRVSGRGKRLQMPNLLLVASFILVLFGIFIGGSRNATALTLLLFIAAVVFFIYENGLDRKKAAILAVFSLLFVVFGYISITKTPQWRTLAQTIPLALDVEGNKCWLDCEKYPLDNVDMTYTHSNYMRIAWFKVGAIIISENPLGRGYEKSAFGHAVKAKYNEGAGEGHSHSDIIDFGIGNGVPGLVMLYAFFLALIYAALKAFKASSSFCAFLLAFMIFGVAARVVVDSMLRDHMLQQIMFLVGLLTVLMAQDEPSFRKHESRLKDHNR